jgi:hypothetical protein
MNTIDVITALKEASYEDLGGSTGVLRQAFAALKDSPIVVPATVDDYKEYVRTTVLHDLKLLLGEIPKHDEGEFCVMPEDVGYRHGHFSAIRYILCRWFTSNHPGAPYDCLEQLPLWYVNCLGLINVVPGWDKQTKAYYSADIVNKMIAIIEAQ